jgi:Tol biopolymer transport system component
MHADGSQSHTLDLPVERPLYPAFSRDGRYMLVVEYALPPAESASLVVIDLTTRTTRIVASGHQLSASAVSPDGRSIAYTSHLDVRAVNWDGSDDRVLVSGPYEAGCCSWGYGHPAFGATSDGVLFATAGIIGSVSLDGSHRRQLLTEDFTRLVFPNVAFSPDGTRFAAGVACNGDRSLRIYTLASLPASCETGTVVTPVTESTAGNQSTNPAWGPNGFIAFQQDRDIYVIPAEGGAEENLTAQLSGDPASVGYPAWAPAGTRLP